MMRASPEEFEERLGEGDDKRVPGAPHRWSPVPPGMLEVTPLAAS